MKQYVELLNHVLNNGERRQTRSGEVLSCFGYQTRYDLSKGFPAVTTKKLQFKSVVTELLWFLRGDTNVKYLHDHNCHIWDEWADKDGNLGPGYGKQWRSWSDPKLVNKEFIETELGGDCGLVHCLEQELYMGDNGEPIAVFESSIDQIKQVVDQIKTDPQSRRLIVSAWNVADISQMALPPCHLLFQFYVSNNKRLSCQLYQRSADVMIGVPFNIASYALLTHMIAQVCDLQVGEFVHVFGDLHLYVLHIPNIEEQLKREPLPLPKLWLNPGVKQIDGFKHEDIKLLDYQHHPAIKVIVAV